MTARIYMLWFGVIAVLLGASASVLGLETFDRIFVAATAALGTIVLMTYSGVVYEAFFVVAVASLHLNLGGPDAIVFLLPALWLTGLAFGHLRLHVPALPTMSWVFILLFWSSLVIANIIGTPNFTLLGLFLVNVCLMLLIILRINSAAGMRRFWIALTVGSVAGTIGGVGALMGFWFESEIFFETLRGGRFQALMGDPNMLGFNLVVVSVWMLDEIVEPKLWKAKPGLLIGLLTIAIIEMIATLSRAAWVGMSVCLFVYLLVRFRVSGLLRIRLRSLVTAACVVVPLLCVVAAFLAATGLEGVVTKRIGSLFDRSDYLEIKRSEFGFTRQALGVAMSNPFGLGTGRTEQIFAEGVGKWKQSVGAHNTFIQVMSDNGWFAFVGYIGLLVTYLKRIHALAMKHENRFGVSFVAIYAGLMGAGAYSMFHDILFWPFAWVLPGIATAMLWPTAAARYRAVQL